MPFSDSIKGYAIIVNHNQGKFQYNVVSYNYFFYEFESLLVLGKYPMHL